MDYRDTLEPLNRNIPLKEKLVHCHEVLRRHLPFVARIAVTLYDAETAVLKTYAHSSGEADPLSNYRTPLDQAPSLKRILEENRPRIINRMVTVEDDAKEPTRRIRRAGYAASYTLPIFDNGVFLGFIFFNSDEPDVLTEPVLHELDVFGQLIALTVISDLTAVRAMVAALGTASHITHQRDPETGTHLERMARYARLIAQGVAKVYQLDDEYIEHIAMFAPLHDVGKIAIPDHILLKPDALTDDERTVMKQHTLKGEEIIDQIISRFSLESLQHTPLLRNIARPHHEALDGTGYPDGRTGEEIPIEARIVAVADVFDALTSQRPYKNAWTNDRAVEVLHWLAGNQLDHDCVEALVDRRQEVEQIQDQFAEDQLG